ncbi:unnamed protein product [Closterium sp. Yama58-4]|nr:unnamed protein product [Closterium sp. Yama58-4]
MGGIGGIARMGGVTGAAGGDEDMARAMESLIPALWQSFAVILIGYACVKLEVVKPQHKQGLSLFVTKLALPALLFSGMASLDFSKVNWSFLLAVTIGKTAVFFLALGITMLLDIGKPQVVGTGAVNGIFVSQSNDFALGLPIFQPIFGELHPEYIGYLYLVAPISLVFLNPLGFLLMESDRKNGDSGEEWEDEEYEEGREEGEERVGGRGVRDGREGDRDPWECCDLVPEGEEAALMALEEEEREERRGKEAVRDKGKEEEEEERGKEAVPDDTSLSLAGLIYGSLPVTPATFFFACEYGLCQSYIGMATVLGTFLFGPLVYVLTQLAFLVMNHYQQLLEQVEASSRSMALVAAGAGGVAEGGRGGSEQDPYELHRVVGQMLVCCIALCWFLAALIVYSIAVIIIITSLSLLIWEHMGSGMSVAGHADGEMIPSLLMSPSRVVATRWRQKTDLDSQNALLLFCCYAVFSMLVSCTISIFALLNDGRLEGHLALLLLLMHVLLSYSQGAVLFLAFGMHAGLVLPLVEAREWWRKQRLSFLGEVSPFFVDEWQYLVPDDDYPMPGAPHSNSMMLARGWSMNPAQMQLFPRDWDLYSRGWEDAMSVRDDGMSVRDYYPSYPIDEGDEDTVVSTDAGGDDQTDRDDAETVVELRRSSYVLLSTPFAGTSVPATTEEVAALNKMKDTLGPANLFVGWVGDPCTGMWLGVICDAPQHVIGINFESLNVDGTLADDVSRLTSLQILNLASNQFTGKLPKAISTLTNLQHLDVSNNKFEGKLPDAFSQLTALRHLDASQNTFTSELPASLSALSSVTYINLANNQITGSLPDSLTGLSELTYLSVADNSMSGTLPASLGSLAKLSKLDLSNNAFTGPVPSTYSAIPDLITTGTSIDGAAAGAPASAGAPTGASPPPPSPPPPSPSPPPPEVSPPPPPPPPPSAPVACGGCAEGQVGWAEGSEGGGQCACVYPLLFTLRLGMEYSQFTAEKQLSLEQQLEAGFSLQPGQVRTQSTRAGSVVADMAVGPVSPATMLDQPTVDRVTGILYGTNGSISLSGFGSVTVVQLVPPNQIARNDTGAPPPSPPPAPAPASSSGGWSMAAIIGVAVAGFVVAVLLVVALVVLCMRCRPSRKDAFQDDLADDAARPAFQSWANGSSAKANGGASSRKSQGVPPISLAELQMATDDFAPDRRLGTDPLGTTYVGTMPDGEEVAVKKIEPSVVEGQSDEDFVAVAANMARLRHAHVVQLQGYCVDYGERILVFQHCAGGSLYDHLHRNDDDSSQLLSWEDRVDIALDAAEALVYLHEECMPPMVHRSISSRNVLLDSSLRARVAGAGLSFLNPVGTDEKSLSDQLVGGFAYNAPEYAMSGIYTAKSDVYSFGVVLLELLTGRKPVDPSKPKAESSLVRWAAPLLHDVTELEAMLDQHISGPLPDVSKLTKFAEVITRCIQPEPEYRPLMSKVVNDLNKIRGPRRDDASDAY